MRCSGLAIGVGHGEKAEHGAVPFAFDTLKLYLPSGITSVGIRVLLLFASLSRLGITCSFQRYILAQCLPARGFQQCNHKHRLSFDCLNSSLCVFAKLSRSDVMSAVPTKCFSC